MIVERDIGRLAKYTFDMGGAGDLLSLSLNVPPWEDLHELSQAELRLTNLVTTDAVAEVLPQTDNSNVPVAELTAKPTQDRFASETVKAEKPLAVAAKSTKTAEAAVPTGAVAVAVPAQ
jgi:hypothetical protein